MRRLAIAVFVGMVLLSGCGAAMFSSAESGVKAVPDTNAVPTTTGDTTTAAPADGAPKTGAPDSSEPHDYARQYLDLVTPPNCEQLKVAALQDLETAHSRDWRWFQQELLPATKVWAASLTTFSEELARADWPPELQSDIDKLIENLTVRVAYLQNVVSATDIASYSKAWEDPYPRDESSADLRVKLGLPPNNHNDRGDCPVGDN